MEGFRQRDGRKERNKEKNPAFAGGSSISQLSAERSFANEPARSGAGRIANKPFYRHFRDVDELGFDHGG